MVRNHPPSLRTCQCRRAFQSPSSRVGVTATDNVCASAESIRSNAGSKRVVTSQKEDDSVGVLIER
jgi:hypothetical protein